MIRTRLIAHATTDAVRFAKKARRFCWQSSMAGITTRW